MREISSRHRVLMAVALLLWFGALASAKVIKDADLPQDWNKVLDKKSGKFYYWNTVSGEVQWHKPFEMDMDELDDVDDLVRGTGIESQDYKILEASASKDVDDFFEGTKELADKIELVGTEKFEGEEGAEEEATDKVKAGSEKRGRRARAKTTKTRTAEKAEKKEPGMCTEPPKEAGGTCGDDKQDS